MGLTFSQYLLTFKTPTKPFGLIPSPNLPLRTVFPLAPENINHPMWVRKIRELKPDIIFSFYYRNMVRKDILSIPPKGCLNLHGSLLPKYRGRCPINWVLLNGTPIQLVDGGNQKRCFTDVSDGVECLFRIIENKGGRCDGKIINIGNPDNEASIRELAEIIVDKFQNHPYRHHFPPFAGIREIESKAFYGEGYQDVWHRKPCIKNAKQLVGWNALKPLEQSAQETLDFFLKQHVKESNSHLRIAV